MGFTFVSNMRSSIAERSDAMSDLLARLKAANAEVEDRDHSLREELLDIRDSASFVAESALEERTGKLLIEGQGFDEQRFFEETIVRRTGRPVLAIVQNEAQLVFHDVESKVWQERLVNASSELAQATQSVGRVEVVGHGLEWLGTGWLVCPDVIVTNRHVAAEFGRRSSAGFVYRQGFHGGAMSASIDFHEEILGHQGSNSSIEQILHIEDDSGPDIAFLRVARRPGSALPRKIELSLAADENEMVAVIGYPARDSRVPDQALMERIFGQVYNKKRLAPGQLTRVNGDSLCHDCSTLGGNSGSVVLSLKNGKAVGLHFAGRFLEANFAVPSAVIHDRLEKVLSGRGQRCSRPVEKPPEQVKSKITLSAVGGRKVSYVIPLQLTIEVGEPDIYSKPVASDALVVAAQVGDDRDEVITECAPEDYRDRQGYRVDFLGDEVRVPLPAVKRMQSDVLKWTAGGKREQVLRYEHFTVSMSKSRRMCLFSAVNIDGRRSKPMARVGWRTDPRIPLAAQIQNECYGALPRFSRGHMTRREDPIWGTDASAARGNQDSMHVTNSVPQIQPFNAGVWLELENYALQHARRDEMKISVFTGPFLSSDDPILFKVRIPVDFWKVIVFIHDQTGELCATGYSMSQRDFLREDEFVFGRHKTAQRSIAWIEQRAGLSFASLAGQDPFREQESFESELTDVHQVQYVKHA
jgi:endonuclease G, mitochondrial